jgi:hypothetical protein
MKRNLLITILLIGLHTIGYSQDKIITVKNDTLDCKISRISHNVIFFNLTTKGVKLNSELPLKSILSYSISGKPVQEKEKGVFEDSFERLRFGLNGGPGYLMARSDDAEDLMVSQGFTPSQAKSYYKDMKWGIVTNADLICMITPNYGAGIKYKFFNTSSNLEGFLDTEYEMYLIYATIKEQIYVNYIGSSYFYQQTVGSQKSFTLNSTLSIGLTTYRNEAKYINSYSLITGNNFGCDISLGLEYFITRHFSIGADLSTFYSSIRKLKISDGSITTTVDLEKDNYENLSRLDFSFGIRFYK